MTAKGWKMVKSAGSLLKLIDASKEKGKNQEIDLGAGSADDSFQR